MVDQSKYMILRVKIFESKLTKNVARFGKMSPFIEASWNKDKWKSEVKSDGHLNVVFNQSHLFESLEAAPLTLKIIHSGLLFTQQEIGTAVISTEELAKGISKDWIEVFFEGKSAGKLLISACMYEEVRSEQSTHTTSYVSVNLKEEYYRKLNELELEKEELEFYKRKYKRKLEKLNQEKRNYQNKVKEIVKKATPKHTEETSSDDFDQFSFITMQNDSKFSGFAKDQVETDLVKLKRERGKTLAQRKLATHSQGSLSEIAKSMDMAKVPSLKKKESQEKAVKPVSRLTSDWEEVEKIKKNLMCSKNEEELELRFDIGGQFSSPRRAVTPKMSDFEENLRFKESHYSTGKFMVYD